MADQDNSVEIEQVQEKKPKKNYIKKFFKAILYVILGLISLNVLIYIALSIPAVQQFVLGIAVDKLKDITKTEISIDQIQLKLFYNVELEGIYVEDLSKDTLLYAQKLEVDISPWRLLHKRLQVNNIDLDGFSINFSQKTPESDFNFQFLIDAFAGDSTQVDTDTTPSALTIVIDNIILSKGKLKYDVLSEPETPGLFNASHIHVSDFNSHLKLPSINPGDLDVKLISLSLKEQSGLDVKSLKGQVSSDNFKIYLADLELDLPHSNLKIPQASYNLLTSEYELATGTGNLSPQDLIAFMPELKFLNNDISLELSSSGKLPTIEVKSLSINYGDDTNIVANGYISDYENYGEADIRLDISNLMASPSAISNLAMLGDSAFVAPDILIDLGVIRLNADLSGRLSDFKLKGEVWSKQGAIQLLANGGADTTFENFKVNAKLQTQNYNLGALMEMPEMGRLSMNINIDASQSAKQPLSASVKGLINHFNYNKQDLSNIPFTAYYNSQKMGAWLDANLPEGKIELKADMTQSKVPVVDFDLIVDQLLLDKFVDLEDWKDPELSLAMKGHIVGLDINELQGSVELNDFKFSHDSVSLYPGKITLDIVTNNPEDKSIKLTSSFLELNLSGKYDFLSLPDEMDNIIRGYLPGLFPAKKSMKRVRKVNQNHNNFRFTVQIQNTTELEEVFDLPVVLEQPLLIEGVVNTIDNDIRASADIPLLQFGESNVEDTSIKLFNTDSLFAVRFNSNIVQDLKTIKLNLNADVLSDTINTMFTAKSDSADFNINASLNALAHFDLDRKGDLISTVQFKPTNIDIGKLNLTFMPALIQNADERTSISDFGFLVGHGRMWSKYLAIDGAISAEQQDTLNINFTNAHVADLMRAFDINNISTVIDGDIKFTNLLDKPEMYTDNFMLSDIIIFGDTLGDFGVMSRWNDAQGAIRFDAALSKDDRKSVMDGWVYPEQDSLDLKVNLDRLSLNWIQPFMSDMLSKVSGSISTGLTAKGRISTPEVRGWLGVNDTYIGIDYTNVVYHIADTIQITPDKIGFNNLVLTDSYNNVAIADALVTYKDFSDIKYNLDLSLNNLLVLNTESRIDSLFYGKIFANGSVNIKGSDESVDIKMNIRNGKKSNLNILIPQTTDASNYQSVVFINTPDQGAELEEDVAIVQDVFPMNLDVDLNVTNNILFKVIINPLTGDEMQVSGSGLIRFMYDSQSEAMNAFGNYIISDGKVKLKLQNIATMEFIIQNGSKVILNGNPMNASFDIKAYKRVKADLGTLDPSLVTGDNPVKVNVDCVLGISGNMSQMNLTYNVVLPDAPEDIQQKVNSLLSTNEQKVRQFAYLLVAGSFYSDRGGGGNNNIAGGLLTDIASGALSAGLNAVFGNVLGNKWNVGANVSSNDGTFSDMDMSVNISRTFLDDRLTFNSNLGYRTDQSLSTENSLIGDFDIQYALTRSVKLKVFSKTNDQFYKQAPFTQGVGIVYTKEAKSIRDLFKVFRKKRKRPKKVTENKEQTQPKPKNE